MRAAAPPWTRRSGIGPWGGGASPSGECSRCEHTRPVALVVAHDASEGGADSGGAGLRAGRLRDGDGDDQKRRVHAAPDRQLRPADGVRGLRWCRPLRGSRCGCVRRCSAPRSSRTRRDCLVRYRACSCTGSMVDLRTGCLCTRKRTRSCSRGSVVLGPKCGAAEQPAASYGGGDGLARRGPAGPARRRVR